MSDVQHEPLVKKIIMGSTRYERFRIGCVAGGMLTVEKELPAQFWGLPIYVDHADPERLDFE